MSAHHMSLHQLMRAIQTTSCSFYELFLAVRPMINMEQKDRYLADIWNSYTLKEMWKQFVLLSKM